MHILLLQVDYQFSCFEFSSCRCFVVSVWGDSISDVSIDRLFDVWMCLMFRCCGFSNFRFSTFRILVVRLLGFPICRCLLFRCLDYREVLPTRSAPRSRAISPWRDSCDFSGWLGHVISAICGSGEFSFVAIAFHVIEALAQEILEKRWCKLVFVM